MSIDTLEYARKLEAAGVARPQAEAHAQAAAELLVGQAIAKPDLDNAVVRLEARIDRAIASEGSRLDQAITRLEAKLDREVARLGNAITQLEAKLDREVARLDGRLNLLTWMVGFNLAATMAVLWKLLR